MQNFCGVVLEWIARTGRLCQCRIESAKHFQLSCLVWWERNPCGRAPHVTSKLWCLVNGMGTAVWHSIVGDQVQHIYALV